MPQLRATPPAKPPCAATKTAWDGRWPASSTSSTQVIVLGGGLSNMQRLYRQPPACCSTLRFSDAVDTRFPKPPVHGDCRACAAPPGCGIEFGSRDALNRVFQRYFRLPGGKIRPPWQTSPFYWRHPSASESADPPACTSSWRTARSNSAWKVSSATSRPTAACMAARTRRCILPCLDHYARLAGRFPAAASQLVIGSMGENLSTAELDERDAARRYLAPRHRLPAALPAAQPVLEDRRTLRLRVAWPSSLPHERLTGWYWRVLTQGTVAPAMPGT